MKIYPIINTVIPNRNNAVPNYSHTPDRFRIQLKPYTYPIDRVSFSSKINTDTCKKIIILIGAPNSGKGTTARALSEHFSIPYIGAGDIIREEKKKGNKFNEIAKQLIEKSGIIPKFTQIAKIFMYKTIKEKIELPAYKKGFVLEGFPRSIEEANMLKSILDREKNTALKIIHLDVNTPILYERSACRYICSECNRTYTFKDIIKLPKCECGGTITKREDDTPEILNKRLKKYKTETLPVIDYYGENVIKIKVKDSHITSNDVINKIISKISD